MTYIEHRPEPNHSAEILCVWNHTIESAAGRQEHRVFPDGCIDIVWVDDAPPVVIGPMTTGRMVSMVPGTNVTGVRLRPGVAQAWLDASASELLDGEVALSEFWGWRAGTPLAGMARGAPARGDSREIVAALGRYKPTTRAVDPRVGFAVSQLAAHSSLSIDAISNELGLSRRQLQRLFIETVGYGPKMLARILRFQRSIALFQTSRPNDRSLARVAAQAGYSDQAHFNREARILAGAPPSIALPGAWTALARMSELFKTPQF